MKLAQDRRNVRPSFTLVELLVVFAIISVLVSLISAAVWKSMIMASRVRVRSEIAQLASALETFKSKYGFYPPSRIKLAELLSNTTYPNANIPGSLDYDSVQTITRMFPKVSTAWANGNPANGPAGINWSGRAGYNGPNPTAVTVLEGDQCLVFFLGGIPDNFSSSINCTGFSTNVLDPSFHIKNGGDTLPPFFEFDSSRLVRAAGQGSPRSAVFYSYLDSYRQRPYAYFSSGNSHDNYNRYFSQLKSSDCRSLLVNPNNPASGTVWPYAEAISPALGALTVPSPRYLNSSSFQIISAGADGLFGTGTIIQSVDGKRGHPAFPPNSAFYASTDPGYDDLSNFRDSIMGTGN
jgi:type II secretory pathway pseudopilin PulG